MPGFARLRPTRRSYLGLSASALGVMALAACGAAEGGSAAGAGDPVSGGTLRFALANDPITIDPQQAGINDSLHIGRAIVDSLTDQDPETGEIHPWLAESWDVSDDAAHFTFHLRDDVTFSDGTALTAQVVKANFEAITADAGLYRGATYFTNVSEITAEDDHTLTVAFSEPSVQFLQATATIWLGIVAQATVDTAAEERGQGAIIGSGPFTLDHFTTGEGAAILRREGYAWGPASALHEGDAYLDRIDFTLVSESSVRTGSLQSGQVDAVSTVAPQDEAAFDGNGFALVHRANPGNVFAFQPNADRPLIQDVRVRQAFSLALDRALTVQTVLTDKTASATGVIASTTPGWSDLGDLLAQDQDRARALLDEAGWTDTDADGIRVRGGRTLTLVVYTYWQEQALELFQQQLREVGIDLQLNIQPNTQLAAIKDSGEWDFGFFNLTRAEPDLLRTTYDSRQNDSAFADPELEALFDQELAETDADARDELVTAIQERIIDQALAIPTHELTSVFATSDAVHDLRFEASSRLSFYDTWIEQ